MNILSIDLDWFNHIDREHLKGKGLIKYKCPPWSELRFAYEKRLTCFFVHLNNICTLPKDIYILREHHFLYPWCLKLGCSTKRKADIINIDEHHDFYNMDALSIKKDLKYIDCSNFFGYMLNDNILREYVWITSSSLREDMQSERERIEEDMSTAMSTKINNFLKKVKVKNRKQVYNEVRNKKFQGCALIESREYTYHREFIVKFVVDFFASHGFNVIRSQMRRNFPHSQIFSKKLMC